MTETLNAANAAYLAKFHIPAEMSAAARLRSVTDLDVRDLFACSGRFRGVDLSGIFFPSFDPLTDQRVGASVRLDNRTEGGPKYIMETGNRHLYFAPVEAELLKDTAVPVIFCEAPTSALALAALAQRSCRTYVIVATSGCTAWKRKDRKVTTPEGDTKWVTAPSPDIDLMHWKGRLALIAFDSNARTNPNVRRARNSFRKELVARGASVSFVEIPAEGDINGPDDLIATRGDKAMLSALDQAGGDADTLRHLIVTAQGAAKPSLANAITILRDAAEWKGVLAYNEFNLCTVARRKPPWQKVADSDWTDSDDIRAADWLQRNGIDIKPRTAAEAAQVVAEENRFHPVKEHFEALRWDCTPRLNAWLTTYLGVEKTKFSQAVGSRWLISAIARIYQPGCRADYVLLLEGPQGVQKSTALRALAIKDEWFTDHISDFDNKDSRLELHGKLIIELGELARIRGSNVEKVKTFLTATADNFRPPYGRRPQHIPRTNVFAASTNSDTPFTDETGNRRFWPVRCGKIDIDALMRDRAQLWGEALQRYRNGEPWWLDTDELNQLAKDEQEERYETGVWDETILPWLKNPNQRTEYDAGARIDIPVEPFNSSRNAVTVTDILVHAVGKDIEKCTQADRNQVTRCLRHAKWKESRKRAGKTKPRFWVCRGAQRELSDE